MTRMKRGVWFPAGTEQMRIERWLGDRKFEIAEKQWLDITREDYGYPDHDYVVISATVDLADLSEEDIADIIELNGLHIQVAELRKDGWFQDADLLVAEGWFEAHAVSDAYVVPYEGEYGELMTSEEADAYLKKVCRAA